MPPLVPPSPKQSSSALRRWLRHSWLNRVPLVGGLLAWLVRPRKVKLPPRVKPPSPQLAAEALEKRWLATDVLGIGTCTFRDSLRLHPKG